MNFLKKSLSVLSVVALLGMFAACDSDSTSASNDEGVYSSSSDVAESSSSVKDNSSSSVALSSSSAVTANSSSNVAPGSSSAVSLNSSSSVIPGFDRGSSCSSSDKIESSSSSVKIKSSSSSVSVVDPADVITGTLVDARDNQTYKTVTIGSQTWMAQNLNYADSATTTSLKGRSWCYESELDSCVKYGRLYTWAAAIDSVALAEDADKPQICGWGESCDRLSENVLAEKPIQGICPNGWHLPSKAEWKALFAAVGGYSSAGKILKSTSGWFINGNGADAYGFSALPAGLRSYDGSFVNAVFGADFWSGSQDENLSDFAYHMNLYYDDERAYLNDDCKYRGYSVRCIKD